MNSYDYKRSYTDTKVTDDKKSINVYSNAKH